ncbi:TetR/AcrR family transcriptional regulator C-terminal domain-containing protein [Microbacterium sp. H1-D42]|uniref:TetR/AcrR family transcriptional regulator C-terminal domain-containing protein n=1 Tax=Microbacterium sp. H1-D42 TaxID=2925844 RepID=UPI001F5367D1|nr:TetR/AcrR family transcriptional regulator C-terminal domain-containing protein [Microbacterium sp. H1-D42]UNK69988.1 TetR/AcrR family transcriptional regulator C-terminal domain-containing protein [Microbacterium sp. H1-D42]
MGSPEHGSGTASGSGVLWTAPPTGRRGPKPQHSLAGIAAAAIAVADAEGLAAVTMQRVAECLDTTKMALYRYLPARSDLDAIMLDSALGTPPAHIDSGWRETLTAWTRSLFDRAVQHPWTAELTQHPHVPGPAELAWYEAGLAATAALPLSGGERLDLLALLSGHALSLVRQRTGSTSPEADLAAGLAPVLAAHGDRYPLTSAAFSTAALDDSRDQALQFGIEAILTGIAAMVAAR